MADIDYNQKYAEMVDTAENAVKKIADSEMRYVAFEKVLNDQLVRFYEKTYNQKGDK